MGIRLDWESDSASAGSKGKGSYVAREDPAIRRARRAARARFMLILFGVAVVIGVATLAIILRLSEANAFIETMLRDTVEAEFAALRIGDWNAYRELQRSATDDWSIEQRAVFDEVQALKQTEAIELTGAVRGVEIDGTRGRVLVEWVRDGTPVTQAWFYWRFEEGWRHVPSDLTFWGSASELRGSRVTVAYRAVDAALAQEMGVRVESWIAGTCGPILQCGDLPHITLDVRPDFYLSTGWDGEQPWRLLIPSPYVHGARSDAPFSGETLASVADVVAARLVSVSLPTTEQFNLTTDAGYLVRAAQSWLVGQYTLIDADSTVIASIAGQKGAAAVGQLLKALRPDSTLEAALASVGITSPTAAGLDWSDFIRYRIRLESDLLIQGDNDAVADLYIDEMRSRAFERTEAAAAQGGVDVRLMQPETGPDGSPALITLVVFGTGPAAQEESVYFYWRGGTWLRAS